MIPVPAPPEARLLALATAVPPHVITQREATDLARRLFSGAFADLERLIPIFENAAIQQRHSCVPLEWYAERHGFAAKNRLYVRHALDLAERAATRCLEQAGVAPESVDAIVLVSSSGIATPSLDARLMERMPFRRDTQRTPIFGLGCAGGVQGLSRAAQIARATPGATVLLIVVELCGITFRAGDRSKSNLVAMALFGDGAAAGLVRCQDSGIRIGDGSEYTWPDSLGVMGWRVADDGLGVLFSRDIPTLVRRDFAPVLDRHLARRDLTRADVDAFVCHPGGAKVLDALEEAIGSAAMTEARAVLRDYGNMSAATVLFVLQQVLAGGRRGRLLLSSLGPGFSAALLTLEVP